MAQSGQDVAEQPESSQAQASKRKRDSSDHGEIERDAFPMPNPPATNYARPINYVTRVSDAKLQLVDHHEDSMARALGLVNDYEGM